MFIGSERCISTTLRRSKRRLQAQRDKRPARTAAILRPTTSGVQIRLFDNREVLNPSPFLFGSVSRGGKMADGRSYRP